MENIVSLFQESKQQNGFYIPQFGVRIENVGLPGNVLRDVLQLTYKDSIKELDSFELTVNNWDSSSNRFKYVETDSDQNNAEAHSNSQLFEPCSKEVQVNMGYIDNLRLMVTGHFTTIEPSFPASGAPTLNVRGLNVLHRLRIKQNSHSWKEKKDSHIVKSLEKGFPIAIQTCPGATNGEPKIDFIAQRNQYDIDFIFSRARERGYVVYIDEVKDSTGKLRKQLYFGPSECKENTEIRKDIPGVRDITFELGWGKSLIDFKPTLTTANQIKSVTVRGVVRSSKKRISATVTLDQLKQRRNLDLDDLLNKCDPREEQVVDEPFFNQKQAEKRAEAILRERHKEIVKASGTTIGLPDLRAGKKVRITGVGKRFSGTYFVTETIHTINDSGYTTKFKARRENEKGVL